MPRSKNDPVAGTARPRFWRRAAVVAGGVAVALLLLFALRAPILTGFARFLTVEDPLAKADAIVLMNGGLETRPAAAAALYSEGLAPIVVLAREEESRATTLGLMPNRTDVVVQLLRHDGVPDSVVRQLRTPGGVTSTQDEARAFHAYARAQRFERIILVTSDYHSRRARRAFRKALDPLHIEVVTVPVPSDEFRAADWWTSEDGLLAIFEEYVKLLRDVVYD
jgi:uncharacterized SAM-binding protein YcdF (DUF218 family)